MPRGWGGAVSGWVGGWGCCREKGDGGRLIWNVYLDRGKSDSTARKLFCNIYFEMWRKCDHDSGLHTVLFYYFIFFHPGTVACLVSSEYSGSWVASNLLPLQTMFCLLIPLSVVWDSLKESNSELTLDLTLDWVCTSRTWWQHREFRADHIQYSNPRGHTYSAIEKALL